MTGRYPEQMSYSVSAFQIDEEKAGVDRDELVKTLAFAGIECRGVIKPLHLCSVYSACEYNGGRVAEQLFRRGICLPASSQLEMKDQEYVIESIVRATKAKRGSGVETFA